MRTPQVLIAFCALLGVCRCAAGQQVAILPHRMQAATPAPAVIGGPVLMEAGPTIIESDCAGADFYSDAPIAPLSGVAYPAYGTMGTVAPMGAVPYPPTCPPGAVAGVPSDYWTWQCLPDGIIYQSYLAGIREPRLSVVGFSEKDLGWQLEPTLGARVGLLRYGNMNVMRPEGFQVDVEGAAFPRVNLEENWDLDAVDFRAGVPITYGSGRWRTKFAYYHMSSHLGDEFLLRNPGAVRINYSRDAIVLGESFYLTDDIRLYAEADWAFRTRGGAEQWEFHMGAEYSPLRPGLAPFLAVNGDLFEENDYGGRVVANAGLQWRSAYSTHLLRTGVYYLNGRSSQTQFFQTHDAQIGAGLWYDF